MKHLRVTALATAIAMASGCASVDLAQMKQKAQEFGAKHGTTALCIAGGVAGAAIGAAVSDDPLKGALIGVAIGTGAGCYAGHVWQKRMQALEQIAKEENMAISVQALDVSIPSSNAGQSNAGLVAQVQDGGMFASGSAKLTPDGQRQVHKLAAAFAQRIGDSTQGTPVDGNRRFLIVGHTDATGSARFNQKLSEQRAREVGKVLQAAGITADRIYYQGAGSSRPVADNSTLDGRSINRRVEINELSSEDMLVKRVQAEAANAKYLAHGTTTKGKPIPVKPTATQTARVEQPAVKTVPVVVNSQPTPVATSQQQPTVAQAPVKVPTPVAAKSASKASIDFGGIPAEHVARGVGSTIKPKSGGFALISSAQASEIPVQSCDVDAPRETGKVLSLATNKPLKTYKTNEYLPGYNNRVWAETVNGHLVTISPVSILRDSAAVDRQPKLQFTKDYTDGKRAASKPITAIANTYEGDDKVLYRVFTQSPNAPVSCMDVVFDKRNAQATEGQLFYSNGNSPYMAKFVPIKAS